MAFIPVPNVAQIVLKGKLDNQDVFNDLYFVHTPGAISQLDLADLASGIALWWNDDMLPLLNEAYTFGTAHGRDLSSSVAFITDQSIGPNAGGVTGEAAPNNCTMSVSFRTAFAGRSYRGRNYIPVLTNSEVSENTIDTGFSGAVRGVYAQLIAGGGSTPFGWTWVVVSRFVNGAPRTTGIFNEIFSVLIVDQIVDSQRRRLPGRGK